MGGGRSKEPCGQFSVTTVSSFRLSPGTMVDDAQNVSSASPGPVIEECQLVFVAEKNVSFPFDK